MYKKICFLPLVLCSLFTACRSINSSRAELKIPLYTVCFSFDDGPNAYGDTTARLLDVLKKYQIKALFCLLGENAECYPELVRRIYDEGHYIVNHGYSDKAAYQMNDDEFKDNLFKGEAAISAALGMDLYPKLYRPQSGFFLKSQEKIIMDAGYTLIHGTVRALDAIITVKEKDQIVRKVTKKIIRQGGGIILLHDGRDSHYHAEKGLAEKDHGVYDRSWIPEVVEEIIKNLLDNGNYKFVPLIM